MMVEVTTRIVGVEARDGFSIHGDGVYASLLATWSMSAQCLRIPQRFVDGQRKARYQRTQSVGDMPNLWRWHPLACSIAQPIFRQVEIGL